VWNTNLAVWGRPVVPANESPLLRRYTKEAPPLLLTPAKRGKESRVEGARDQAVFRLFRAEESQRLAGQCAVALLAHNERLELQAGSSGETVDIRKLSVEPHFNMYMLFQKMSKRQWSDAAQQARRPSPGRRCLPSMYM
jgi:hypothetical protein